MIQADRLWAQEREYIVPRIRIAAVRSVKIFSSVESVRENFAISLGGWTEMLYCKAQAAQTDDELR
jgi:hypothetical protein